MLCYLNRSEGVGSYDLEQHVIMLDVAIQIVYNRRAPSQMIPRAVTAALLDCHTTRYGDGDDEKARIRPWVSAHGGTSDVTIITSS